MELSGANIAVTPAATVRPVTARLIIFFIKTPRFKRSLNLDPTKKFDYRFTPKRLPS
jgi:hypothetical protein